jgi:predicted AAA+ superfamily ATPase
MEEFGKNEYENYVRFDFKKDQKILNEIFERNPNPIELFKELSLFSNININREKTLIIFDEIQRCKSAISILKTINETCNDFHVICAGSQ